MDPSEIAKLITEHPDVFKESADLEPVEIPKIDKPKKSRKKPAKPEKDKKDENEEEYKADMFGVPIKGQILYSDIETTEEITEAGVKTKEIPIKNIILHVANKSFPDGWSDGGLSKSIKERDLHAVKTTALSWNDLISLKNLIQKQSGNATFIRQFNTLNGMREKLIKAARGKEITQVEFPPDWWWGVKSWQSYSKKEHYIDIFMGEVATVFIKLLVRHAKSKFDNLKQQINFIIEELKAGRFNPIHTFDNFKEKRSQAILNFRLKFRDLNKRYELPQGNIIEKKLRILYSAIKKQYGNMLRMQIPIYPFKREVASNPATLTKFSHIARQYLNDQIVDEILNATDETIRNIASKYI